MKLPIILSAMIAALAIPGSFEAKADDQAKAEAAASEAAPAPEAAAPEAAPAPEAKVMKKKKHHRHHHHRSRSPFDLAYDDPNFPRAKSEEAGCGVSHRHEQPHYNKHAYKGEYNEALRTVDGDPDRDYSPRAGQGVQPGFRTH